jgi:hypothetical protein
MNGYGVSGTPLERKGFNVFKVAMGTKESPRVNTPRKHGIGGSRKSEKPETANPALGGILSRRLHAFDGAGRCYLALGHLTFIRSEVRS